MTRDMTHQLIVHSETSQTAAGWQHFSDLLQGPHLCVQYREKAMGAFVNVLVSLALKSNSVHTCERGSKSVYRVQCQSLASKQLVSTAKLSSLPKVKTVHS